MATEQKRYRNKLNGSVIRTELGLDVLGNAWDEISMDEPAGVVGDRGIALDLDGQKAEAKNQEDLRELRKREKAEAKAEADDEKEGVKTDGSGDDSERADESGAGSDSERGAARRRPSRKS